MLFSFRKFESSRKFKVKIYLKKISSFQISSAFENFNTFNNNEIKDNSQSFTKNSQLSYNNEPCGFSNGISENQANTSFRNNCAAGNEEICITQKITKITKSDKSYKNIQDPSKAICEEFPEEEAKESEFPISFSCNIQYIKKFKPVESSFNIQGNYQDYISQVIRSLSPLTKIDFTPFIQERLVLLPEYNKKKTLLLDLDETLIHADFDERYVEHHKKISFKFQDEEVSVDIFIRPGAKEFLKKCAEIFEVFIFTASKKEYADACIDYLDPDRKIIKHRLYRDSCIPVNNKTYIKDLRIFVNRKQENLILVDNSFYSFCNQPRNGILINSFYDDPKDQELGNLVNYLENYLLTAQDIRVVNEQIFNFAGIIEQCLNVKKELFVQEAQIKLDIFN